MTGTYTFPYGLPPGLADARGLRGFVKDNRPEIDVRILIESPGFSDITDADRALWVLTIDPIKEWAISKGLII